MEFFFKILIDLASNLSVGGLITLVALCGLLVWFTIKATLKFSTILKDQNKEETFNLKNIADELAKINSRIDEMSNDTDKDNEELKSAEKKIEAQTLCLIKDITIMKNELVDMLDKNDSRHEQIEFKLEKIKIENEHTSQMLKEFGIEDRSNHNEILRQIQSLLKDIAVLQGTILGNMSAGRTTLSK